MCVYEGYNKARDCRQETLVKYEVHRYMNTNEWINAAKVLIITVFFFIPLTFKLNDIKLKNKPNRLSGWLNVKRLNEL